MWLTLRIGVTPREIVHLTTFAPPSKESYFRYRFFAAHQDPRCDAVSHVLANKGTPHAIRNQSRLSYMPGIQIRLVRRRLSMPATGHRRIFRPFGSPYKSPLWILSGGRTIARKNRKSI